MALFKILRGPSNSIQDEKKVPLRDGYAYFTPDKGNFYIDARTDESNAASVKRIWINPPVAEFDSSEWGKAANDRISIADKYINYIKPPVVDPANHRMTIYDGEGVGKNVAMNFVNRDGDTMTGDLNFVNNDSGITKGIYFQAGTNDGARIVSGATAQNAGYLEIATTDDGNEPIYVRQYGDGGSWKSYGTATRTLTLLDASGNTSIPGSLTAVKDITAPKFHGIADYATYDTTERGKTNKQDIANKYIHTITTKIDATNKKLISTYGDGTTAQIDLENLEQIGGRNLLLNSSGSFTMGFGIPTTIWNKSTEKSEISLPVTVTFDEVLPQTASFGMVYSFSVGSTYTQSITVETDANFNGVAPLWTWFEPSGRGHIVVDGKIAFADNHVYVFSSTHTIQNGDNGNVRIMDLANLTKAFDFTTGTYLRFSHPKIERGNEATDWTPAPEDLAYLNSSPTFTGDLKAASLTADDSLLVHGNATFKSNINTDGTITAPIIYGTHQVKIAKNGSAGYGLTNSDGTSIIRDHGNKNVTIDATGGELYLAYENTNRANFFSNKVYVNNNGSIDMTGKLNSTYANSVAISNQNLISSTPTIEDNTDRHVGQNTLRNFIGWQDYEQSLGYRTRYRIGSQRAKDGWGRMYLAVGNSDNGTSYGSKLELSGNGWSAFTGRLGIGTIPVAPYQLDVNGQTRLRNPGAASNSPLVVGGMAANINTAVTGKYTTTLQIVAGDGGPTNGTGIAFHNPLQSSASFGYYNTADGAGHFEFNSDNGVWDINVNNHSIVNLPTGGGIYWNPHVESASDASDAASITQIKSGVAGGTELRIQQQNDSNDVINLVVPDYIYLNGKRAFTINVDDPWLRINQDLGFSSGIYTGSSLIRSDNQLQVGDSGDKFRADWNGDGYFSHTLGIAGQNTGYNLYVNGTSLLNGDTSINGTLRIDPVAGNWQEGIRIAAADTEWVTIALGTTAAAGTHAKQWSIHRKNDGNFCIAHGESSGTSGLFINTSNNIGMGTINPAYKLHVIGDIYANGGWLRSSGATGWYSETYGGGWWMTDDTYIRSFNGKSTRLDNLCLGSDNNSYRLYVNGTSLHTNTINIEPNTVAIDFRYDNNSCHSTLSYQTDGHEALVFANKYPTASFIFVTGEDSVTNHDSSRWQSLTPGLQIKENCVSIGELIANGTHPSYKLTVNGHSYFKGDIYINPYHTIYQKQDNTSNYTTIATWLKGGSFQKDGNGNAYSYQPQIGQHNTGGTDSLGSICILPYATSSDPWNGNVGLFITKNKLTLDSYRIPTTGNSSGTVGSVTAPVYSDNGVLRPITSYSGNSASATELINARNFYISDNAAKNTGPATSFNGTANATIKLPAMIQMNSMATADVDAMVAAIGGGSGTSLQDQINKKQNILTFDTTPKSDSSNPVTSSGIYNYVNTTDAPGLKLTGGRPTSMDTLISSGLNSKITYTIATSSTTTGKPPEDSGVLTFGWDNDNWGAQIAIGMDKNNHMFFRGSDNTSWETNWTRILDTRDLSGYAFYKFPNGTSFSPSNPVTYQDLTITTKHGGPVYIHCDGDLNPTSDTSCWMTIELLRNGTLLASRIVSRGNSWNVPFSISYLDIVAKGTYTYRCRFTRGNGEATLTENGAAQSPNFTVFEI